MRFQFMAAFTLSTSMAMAGTGGTVAYFQATGYSQQSAKPGLFQPLNLIDGKPTTAWCSPTSDPLNELMWFGFKQPVSLDSVRITTGNAADAKSFEAFARVRKLSIRSGKEVRMVELEDLSTPQTLTLSPPLNGTRFLVEVLDQHPADDISAPVCMSDLIPLAAGQVLAGPSLAPKLKFDKNTSQLMGAWYAGSDATPDHFLTFHFDGTFSYAYEPFDANRNKPKSLSGTYEVSGNRLTFSAGGKRFLAGFAKDAGRGANLKLNLSGELPPELQKLSFRSKP